MKSFNHILASIVKNGQEQDPSQVPDLLAQVDRATVIDS